MTQVIILSDKVKSGKSTMLFNTIKKHSNIFGFITPRWDNKMVFYEIHKGNTLPYELENTSKNTIQIGQYFLNNDAFTRGVQLMLEYEQNPKGIFIIDEIGRLEVNQSRGYEPNFSNFLHHMCSIKSEWPIKIIVVVRDTLLETFIQKYGIYVTDIYSDFLTNKEVAKHLFVD